MAEIEIATTLFDSDVHVHVSAVRDVLGGRSKIRLSEDVGFGLLKVQNYGKKFRVSNLHGPKSSYFGQLMQFISCAERRRLTSEVGLGFHGHPDMTSVYSVTLAKPTAPYVGFSLDDELLPCSRSKSCEKGAGSRDEVENRWHIGVKGCG